MSWEDVDDETFLRRGDQMEDGDMGSVDEIENRSLESTKRSLRRLAEAELTGVSTTEELVKNRESLKNISISLDGISANLKKSQKHIDSIRSVFANFRSSLFGKKTDVDVDKETKSVDPYVIKPRKNNFSYSFPWSGPNQESMTSLQGRVLTGDLTSSNNPFTTGAIEDNIEAISNAVGRLKGLAAAMGQEIDTHNTTLSTICEKAASNHLSIAEHERSIEKIL